MVPHITARTKITKQPQPPPMAKAANKAPLSLIEQKHRQITERNTERSADGKIQDILHIV